MPIEIVMPQGGQDIVVGRVSRWLKSEGEPVTLGELICEVETEKAVFEVNAPGEGYLRKIIVPAGEEVPIFSVIGYIGALDEEIPIPRTVKPSVDQARPRTAVSATEEVRTAPATPAHPMQVSPRARRLADENNVSLDLVRGSGAGGRIMEKDILAYLESRDAETRAETTSTPRNGRVVPMSRTQSATARRMQQSKQTVPHYYLTLSVDMTRALAYREEFNQRLTDPAGEPVSVTDLIIRACVLAFRTTPELNASVVDDDKIIFWEDLNVGLAVAVGDDLVVPVMEGIDRASLAGIAQERHRLVSKARDGKQSSLAQARFTISNLGMAQIDQFLAIINPPETAILAVSSIQKRPVAVDDLRVAIRDMVSLSLSVDHRVVNGLIACRFLNSVKAALEDPASLG